MKRLFVSLLALAGIVYVGSAFALDAPAFTTLRMRNTAASATARDPNWATIGNSPSGFVDSVVFRRGATTATVYDTSVAFEANDYTLPPNMATMNAAVGDTVLPWIFLRVRQDSVRTSNDPLLFTGSSSLDSVRFAVEHSPDGGRTWFSCPGTPTYRFDAVYMTSGQDGLQSPTLIGVESSPGEDVAIVPIKASSPNGNAYIVNRNLPYVNEKLRLIIGMDATGQFQLEVGHWPARNPDVY